ncbi:MAG: division/cell wall cluster transcriptional repressor MraZ [Parvibaculales bacterium]
MSAFLSTVTSKIDSKGRVSVPAAFRAVAGAQGFNGIYLYPSFTENAIEGGGQALMDNVSRMLAQLDPYTDESDALSTALFADSHQMAFDGDGRISIPEMLLDHAGIEKGLTFVGLGAKFQIWNPDKFVLHREAAREKARQHRGLLRSLSPSPPTSPPGSGQGDK